MTSDPGYCHRLTFVVIRKGIRKEGRGSQAAWLTLYASDGVKMFSRGIGKRLVFGELT